jgi:hypothetical protein
MMEAGARAAAGTEIFQIGIHPAEKSAKSFAERSLRITSIGREI